MKELVEYLAHNLVDNPDAVRVREHRGEYVIRIELRVEAFNLFDTVNWANPEVEINQNDSGMITNTTGDPRIMQFAVKYAF